MKDKLKHRVGLERPQEEYAQVYERFLGMVDTSEWAQWEKSKLTDLLERIAGVMVVLGIDEVKAIDLDRDLDRIASIEGFDLEDFGVFLKDVRQYVEIVRKKEWVEEEMGIDVREFSFEIPNFEEEIEDEGEGFEIIDYKGVPIVIQFNGNIHTMPQEYQERLAEEDFVLNSFMHHGSFYIECLNDETGEGCFLKDFKKIGPKTEQPVAYQMRPVGEQVCFFKEGGNGKHTEVYDEQMNRLAEQADFKEITKVVPFGDDVLIVGKMRIGNRWTIVNQDGKDLIKGQLNIQDVYVQGDQFYYTTNLGELVLRDKTRKKVDKYVRHVRKVGERLVYWNEAGRAYDLDGTALDTPGENDKLLAVGDKIWCADVRGGKARLYCEGEQAHVFPGDFYAIHTIGEVDGVGYYAAEYDNSQGQRKFKVLSTQGEVVTKDVRIEKILGVHKLGEELYFTTKGLDSTYELRAMDWKRVARSKKEITKFIEIGEKIVYFLPSSNDVQLGVVSVYDPLTLKKRSIFPADKIYTLKGIDEHRFYVIGREGERVVKKVFDVRDYE
jgi:hypothetical protein